MIELGKFIIFILAIFSICNVKVYAQNLMIEENIIAYEDNEDIIVNSSGTILNVIKNAKLLDLNEEYILFNRNNKIYLYDIYYTKEKAIDNGYNGLFMGNNIVYENNSNDKFKCNSIINNVVNNCYKLYKTTISDNKKTYLNIPGNDIYLNDIYENTIVYNSIHNGDLYCALVCSYIGVYRDENYLILNNYNDLELSMSGNGYIDNNIIAFESFLSLYDCNGMQIFIYDMKKDKLEIILNDNKCFNVDIQLVDLKGDYILFEANLEKYDNNLLKKYIYSIDDYKFKKLDIEEIVTIYNDELVSLNNSVIKYYSIDTNPPYIDKSVIYNYLKGKEEIFKSTLKIEDDLTNIKNISISILNIGEDNVTIEMCDRYLNCSVDTIVANILDSDIQEPKIYSDDILYLPKGTIFEINKYAYAIDDIDGEINIDIINAINYSLKEQEITLVAIDSSGNKALKKITLIIYSESGIYRYYFSCMLVSLLLVLIIYIFRFKKWIRF